VHQNHEHKVLTNHITIIGGRSTGKSTLLQLIACRINSSIRKNIDKFITDIPQEAIKIIWQDDEENKDREIEFFKKLLTNW
jgi:shikimate kinase